MRDLLLLFPIRWTNSFSPRIFGWHRFLRLVLLNRYQLRVESLVERLELGLFQLIFSLRSDSLRIRWSLSCFLLVCQRKQLIEFCKPREWEMEREMGRKRPADGKANNSPFNFFQFWGWNFLLALSFFVPVALKIFFTLLSQNFFLLFLHSVSLCLFGPFNQSGWGF